MPKQGKQALQDALASRSPMGQRQAIVPVNILEEATLAPPTPNAKTERKKDTDKASPSSERKERVEKASDSPVRTRRTHKPNGNTEFRNRTILAEPEKPETIRDSYEAYVDQLETIEALRALYRKKTGRPLSKSRVIREALANFLPLALDAYQEEEQVIDAQPVAQPAPVEQKTAAPVVKKQPAEVEAPAPVPEHLVTLQSFADLHAVNRNEAERLWKTGMIVGTRQSPTSDRYHGKSWPVMLGAKGRRDFWVQFHETPGFRACDNCPHGK